MDPEQTVDEAPDQLKTNYKELVPLLEQASVGYRDGAVLSACGKVIANLLTKAVRAKKMNVTTATDLWLSRLFAVIELDVKQSTDE
jgi:hypothetical protein